MVEDATARIAPGPADDPAEAGHPGAREADVTGYIDTMLAALDGARGTRCQRSSRAARGATGIRAPGPDLMARFIALDPVARIAWRKRLAGLAAAVPAAASRPWTSWRAGTSPRRRRDDQDTILASQEASAFLSLLFEHTIEGLYAKPEYGGNRGLAGWTDIGYPGDIQPRGYTARTRSTGPDGPRSGGRHGRGGRSAEVPRRGVKGVRQRCARRS